MTEITFKDLVVTDEIEEEVAVKLVAPYVKYTSTGDFIFLPQFKSLRDNEKVLRYLIARVGLRFIQGESVKVEIGNKEISTALNLSYSSVRVYIAEFRKKGWVTTNSETKEHIISPQAIYDLSEKEERGGE